MIDPKKLQIAITYLFEGTTYVELDKIFFNGNKSNHGGNIGKILNKLGIYKRHSRILKNRNIDDEIKNATGQYKNTLIEIKNALSSGISIPSVKIKPNINKKTFKPLTQQEEIDLKEKLSEKLYEKSGIIDLLLLMTKIDSSVEFKIELKRRKKIKTHFYKEINSFLKNNTPKYIYKKYNDLQNLVEDIINADDNKTYHNVLKPYIQEMLEVIIGHNYNKNISLCDKASSYIEKLEKALLIMVLNGEYIEEKTKIYDTDKYFPVIILYLENIWDYCEENNFNYYEMIFTVFAHEYLHLHHYDCLHKHNSFKLDNAINKYNPGTIVKESLASYFEYSYALIKGYNDIANILIDSWNKNDENYWPYAGAKTIRNYSHFDYIFYESLHSFKNALIIKNK